MIVAHVRARWFVSLLGVTTVPFLIAIFIFVRGERLIRDESSRVYDGQLSVLVQGLDSVLDNVRALEISMFQDEELKQLSSGSFPRSEEYLVARNLIRKYGELAVVPGGSVDWIVFMVNSNKVLAPTAYTSDINYLGREIYGRPSWTLSGWRLTMRNLDNQQIQLMGPAGWNQSDDRSVLVYSRHVSTTADGNPEAILVFDLSTPLVRDLMDSMLAEPRNLLMFRSRGQAVAIGSGEAFPELDLPNTLHSEPSTVHSNGVRYSIFHDQTQFMPIDVFFAVADAGTSGALRVHRIVGIFALLLCLAVAVALSALLVVRQYNPVRRLLQLVIGSKAPDVASRSDEFRVIEDALTRAMDETVELRSVVLGHERSLEIFRFRSLLRGVAADTNASAAEYFRLAGVEHFSVLLIDPVAADDASRVERTVRDHFDGVFSVCDMVSMGTGICVVVGTAGNMESGHFVTHARALLESLHSQIGTDVALATSEIYKITDSIRAAVEDAQRALEYRIVDGTRHLLESHVATIRRETFEFPLNLENELINHVVVGEFEEALAITDSILQRNFVDKALDIEMGRCLAFSLATMFVRTLNRVSRFREINFWDELRPIDRISRCRTYESLRATIVDLLKAVCEEIATHKQTRSEVLVQSVIDYVSGELDDPNLGTKRIADHFDMNPAYLARVFREQQGLSLSDYINKTRIEISKQLLSATDRTLADIGNQIGYPQSSSFIRFFKKFEGITPGAFRDG
jgi:AraC-like DNA-binding protein